MFRFHYDFPEASLHYHFSEVAREFLQEFLGNSSTLQKFPGESSTSTPGIPQGVPLEFLQEHTGNSFRSSPEITPAVLQQFPGFFFQKKNLAIPPRVAREVLQE